MKSVYSPRLKFRHPILDDDQLIVEEGVSALTDLSYLHGISLSSRRNEPAYYVRSLVKDCARQDLGYKLKCSLQRRENYQTRQPIRQRMG